MASRLVCHGCGTVAALDDTRPYRCRRGDDDNVDHVLRRAFDAATFKSWSDADAIFRDLEPNPFRKFRRLFYSYEIAKLGGITDSGYLRIVDRLDAAIAGIDGKGFRATPFAPQAALARAIGLESDCLRVKDETRNVSGSHKGRHLMGIMLWLETLRAVRGGEDDPPTLAVASCGNAALAAAVLTRAAGRRLQVFAPPEANPRTTDRLAELGAELTRCPRRASDPPGDPCYLRFLEACRAGALPFTVQGRSNGLTVEGGSTLVWEVVAGVMAGSQRLDHLVVQVGGGALAASCIEGLRDARDLGLVDRLPRIHTVQTASAYPLRRAYDLLVSRLPGLEPRASPSTSGAFDSAADNSRALFIRDEVPVGTVTEALEEAARHRSDFMWPWETPPESLAYGILDDETYDWLAVLGGMLETGGVPLVVSEPVLAQAHRLAHDHTSIPVEPTGSAGLAGLLALETSNAIQPGERVALLFTGIER